MPRLRRPVAALPPLHVLLAASDVMMCLHKEDGEVVYASPAARALLGVEPAALLGKPLIDIVHPADRLAVLARWHRPHADKNLHAEFRIARPDGTVIWAEADITPIDDTQAARAGIAFASSVRDITRRYAAEAELRAARDDLAAAVAAGPGMLFSLSRAPDRRWDMQFVSASVERITGYAVATAMAPGWPSTLLDRREAGRRQRVLEEAFETGAATIEYRLPSPSGAALWMREHVRRWEQPDGAVELIGYGLNITAEYEARQRLSRMQEDIDAVLEAGPGMLYRAMIGVDGERQFIFVSDNAERVTGFTAEELMAPGWFDTHVEPIAIESAVDRLRDHATEGAIIQDFRVHDRDGKWRWVSDNMRVLVAGEATIEVVGYWADISREKEQAAQLADTAKLATLGEMAAGMAHELNQPLASISLAAENALFQLQAEPPNLSAGMRKLERITEQAQRASKLIDHLRLFGRRSDTTPQPVDMRGVVEGALTIVGGRVSKAGIQVALKLAPDLPQILGQGVLLEQVLINVITNACDAYRGRPARADGQRHRILIEAGVQGGFVVLTVTDQAGGIPEPVMERIFEPFFTTKPPGQGTGLGLSISYGIVRDMGGAISVRNEGEGACFELRLPAHHAQTMPRRRRRAGNLAAEA